MKNWLGMVCAVCAAALYGLCAVLTKLYTSGTLSIATMAAMRGAMGAMLLLIINGIRRKPIHISKSNLPKACLLGLIGNAATLLILNASYGFIPAGTATTIHYIYPAIVCLAGAIFFRQRLSAVTWGSMAMCVGSLFFMMGQFDGTQQLPGVLLAVLSAVTWSFQLVYLEHSGVLAEDKISLSFVFCCMISVSGIVYGLATGTLDFSAAMPSMGGILLIALLNNVLAMLLLQRGIAYVGASVSAILGVFEPICSILFGYLLLHETLTSRQMIGCAMVLASVSLLILYEAKGVPQKNKG